MTNNNGPDHVVVDGSNIATEGRSLPSLKQLQEAVMSFMGEHPDTAITVVVDATFGHRIDKKEAKEFEEGISNNELVAPPAGAVGRGDAFVLGIADKAGASVLSNDSFQEFHGEYEWLFDEGRLIGGKPVPHVGWVWVDRVPVRGPVSRKATGGRRGRSGGGGRSRSKSDDNRARTGSKEASGPMPVPKEPPPSRKAAATTSASTKSSEAKVTEAKDSGSKGSDSGNRRSSSRNDGSSSRSNRSAPKGGEPVNELMPFLEFVETHPAGTEITATVDSYSSHGAYVAIGDTEVRGYVPLRLMAEPAPRSAKKVMKIGEEISLVVVSFAAARRSIDCAVPDLAEQAIADAEAEALESGDGGVEEASAPEDASRNETSSRKSAAKRAPAKKSAAKKTAAKKAPPKKTASKKTAAKKAPAKKSASKKTAAKKAPAKKTAATKSAAKKTVAKKAPAKKTAAKKAAAKKAPAKKTAAKKTAAKKAPAKKAPAKKTAAKKAAAKKAPAKKAAAKRATRTRSADETTASNEES